LQLASKHERFESLFFVNNIEVDVYMGCGD